MPDSPAPPPFDADSDAINDAVPNTAPTDVPTAPPKEKSAQGVTAPRSADASDSSPSSAGGALGSSARTLRTVGRGRDLTLEVQRTKTLVRRPTRDKDRAEPIGGTGRLPCRNKLLLYLLDDLPTTDRAEIESLRTSDPMVQEELTAIRRHLEIHRAQSPVKLRPGGLLRLTKVMRKEGYLVWSYPGTRALWWRAVAVGIFATAVTVLMLTWLSRSSTEVAGQTELIGSQNTVGDDGSVGSTPETISAATAISTGAEERQVWLATQRVGVSTLMRIDRGTQCTIQNQSRVSLEDGMLLSVGVSKEAGFSAPFEVRSHIGIASTYDALFSVKKDGDLFEVNTASGEVTLLDLARGRKILVPAGMGCRLFSDRAEAEVYPLVELRAERAIGEGRKLRVRLINRSLHPVHAEYPREADSPYTIRVVQDRSLRAIEPRQADTSLLRSHLVSSASLPSTPTLTLAVPARDSDSQLSLEVNLVSVLGDHEWTDYSATVEYHGPLILDHLGTLTLHPQSPIARLNFKDTTTQ